MSGLAAGMQGVSLAAGASDWQQFPVPPGAASLFAEADADGDGQVGRADAKGFFVRTGIPGPILAKVRSTEPLRLPRALHLLRRALTRLTLHSRRVVHPMSPRSGRGATSAPAKASQRPSSRWPCGAPILLQRTPFPPFSPPNATHHTTSCFSATPQPTQAVRPGAVRPRVQH